MPFRYGDYSALKRNYLPPDYLRDAGALNIVKTVHEEALWDPTDPAGETRWLEQVARGIRLSACAASAPRSSRATTSQRCWRRMPRAS